MAKVVKNTDALERPFYPSAIPHLPDVPRVTERPVPQTPILDECGKLNELWIPHVDGVLSVLLDPTLWAGSDTEKAHAVQEIYRLMKWLYLCEENDMQFRQLGCDLQLSVNGTWQTIYTLSVECVSTKVQQGYESGNYNPPSQRGNGDSRTIDNSVEQATVLNDLNAVWGACLELCESLLDFCRILCDMIEAGGDALGFLSNILESPVSSVTEWVADDNTGTQRNWSTTGQSKWGVGDNVRTYEQTITEPIRGVSPSKILAMAQRALDIGVAIIRGSFNEDFQEAIAGILFNLLTCLPDGTRKQNGIVLTTEKLSQFGDELLADSDLIKKFVGVTVKAEELAGGVEFLSFLNLPDLFKQYRVGALVPLSTWTVLVDPCSPPPVQCGHNYVWLTQATIPTNIVQYQQVPIGTALVIIPIVPLQWQRVVPPPVNNQFRQLLQVSTYECDKPITLLWARGSANSATGYIDTWDGATWTRRAVDNLGVGGATGITRTLNWANGTGITYLQARVGVQTAQPFIIQFRIQ